MANYFLKVNKDLFKLGLNPTEILVLAQIMEFNTNTGDCFISDKTLAENFGVSEKTISRTIKALEDKGYIKRNTTNVQKGKERHITLTTDNLSIGDNNANSTTDKLSIPQQTNCPLRNRQNDLIKDKLRDKEIDNYSGVIRPTDEVTPLVDSQKEEVIEIEGQRAQEMTAQEAQEKYGLSACASRISTGINGCFWIGEDLVKLMEVKQ